MKYLLGFILAIIALFWFFIIEFIECSTTAFDDFFYFGVAALLLFAMMVAAALGYVIYESTIGRKNIPNIALATLFIACAVLSFLFRYELNLLADKTFFLKNQAELEGKVTTDVAVVKRMSSYNFHKLFLYAGPHLIEEGRLSLETQDALGEPSARSGGARSLRNPSANTSFF